MSQAEVFPKLASKGGAWVEPIPIPSRSKKMWYSLLILVPWTVRYGGLGLPLVDPLHVSLEGRVRPHLHRTQVTGVGVRVREMLRFNMVPKHNSYGRQGSNIYKDIKPYISTLLVFNRVYKLEI
jgi:hypothetical protein